MRHPVVIVLLIAAVTSTAGAQDTGGSMGGGSWESGGGGGGGDTSYSGDSSSSSGGADYSYSGGGDSSSSSGGGDYSSSSDDSSDPVAGLLIVAMFFVGALIVKGLEAAHSWRLGRRSSYLSPSQAAQAPASTVDVTVVRVALDARVRPYAQKELDRIATVADTGTQQGLVVMLNQVALMLRRLRDAWVYGGAENHPMRAMGNAHVDFKKEVAAARGSFRHELVRNADGIATTGDVPDRGPRAEEGPGLVLVTLVVAARTELFTIQTIDDGNDLRRALEVLSALTDTTLVAVEIVWTPAADGDRMSSIELEALLPGDIFAIHGAMVGKVVCGHCSGPFPAELVSCPHCGAPARHVAAA